jgi:hypothetical protein
MAFCAVNTGDTMTAKLTCFEAAKEIFPLRFGQVSCLVGLDFAGF